MESVSESLAQRLKTYCRYSFLVGLLALGWAYWEMRQAAGPADLPTSPQNMLLLVIVLAAWLGSTLLLGLYLDLFLGLDVFGLNGLLGMPTGKPFRGLEPGEEDRLRFNFSQGMLGWASYGGIFKLRLTNQRLLVGANLTSWHLLEVPLREIITAEVRRGWLASVLRLTRVGPAGTEQWRLGLQSQSEFDQLVGALKELGVPVEERRP